MWRAHGALRARSDKRTHRDSPTQPSGNPKFWRDWQFWSCLALGPIAWALIALNSAVAPDLAFPPRLFRESPLRFVAVVALYPLLEEIIFRGWVQPSLATRLRHRALPGISAANFITSALFAAAHLIHQAPPQAIATFLPSLVFGYLRERFGTIVPCVLMHAFYNLGYFSLFPMR